jgi:hypothetical protein
MAATIAAVWLEHRSVLNVSYNFTGFARAVWSDFSRGLKEGLDSMSRQKANNDEWAQVAS